MYFLPDKQYSGMNELDLDFTLNFYHRNNFPSIGKKKKKIIFYFINIYIQGLQIYLSIYLFLLLRPLYRNLYKSILSLRPQIYPYASSVLPLLLKKKPAHRDSGEPCLHQQEPFCCCVFIVIELKIFFLFSFDLLLTCVVFRSTFVLFWWFFFLRYI